MTDKLQKAWEDAARAEQRVANAKDGPSKSEETAARQEAKEPQTAMLKGMKMGENP